MKFRTIALFFLLSVYSVHCGPPNEPRAGSLSRLAGSWEQKFIERVGKEVTVPEDRVPDYPLTFVSLMTFDDSLFRIDVSDTASEQIDFSIKGRYEESGDTLLFLFTKLSDTGREVPSQFQVAIRSDTLFVSCAVLRIGGGMVTGPIRVGRPIRGLPWLVGSRYVSAPRCSGTFQRLK